MKKKLDASRLTAIIFVLLAIIYFYVNLLTPRLIPNFLRIGIIRHPINILLMGTDMTFDSVTQKALPKINARTDTLALIHVDPIRGEIYILSIPRDTLADIPGYWPTKINAANVYGGPDLIKQTVTNLTGVQIDYFLQIRPTGLIKMVDLIGGVNIDVEKDMRYIDRAQKLDINLKAGQQKLSGKKAHEYIRFRHDAFGDIGRVERQQKFFRSLVQSLKKPSNIIKAPFAIIIALQEINTDLPLNQTIRLLNFSRMARIESMVASGEGRDLPVVGSVWIIDKQSLKEIIREHF